MLLLLLAACSPAGADPRWVQPPLDALRDHDFFAATDGGAAPFLVLTDPAAIRSPVPLDVRTYVAPDAILLGRAGAAVTIPLGEVSAHRIYVLTAGYGSLDARGIAADGEVRFADGRTQALKWMIGEQAWPAWAGASGRGATAIYLGQNRGGDPVTASLLDVPLSFPEVPASSLTITARGGLQLAVLAVTLGAGPDPLPEAPVSAERVADAAWYRFSVPGVLSSPLPGPVPVGVPRHGPVEVRDGHLAYVGGDRVRYWGVNLVSRAALPAREDAADIARSLALHGFNLARLHHLDFDGEGSVMNPLRGQAGEEPLAPAALDRLDRFVAALGDAGVDIDLELLTLRSWTAAEAGPAGLAGVQGVPGNHKYVGAIWPAWLRAQEAHARALWGRVNPYTGRRYADDPHVALVEVANENSLLNAWGSGNLDKLPRVHRDELDRRWSAWLRGRYGSDARIAAAWATNGPPGPVRGGLQPGETLDLDTIAREPASRFRTELFPQARSADLVAFYADLQAAYEKELTRFVREDLGFRAPVVCNSALGFPHADALAADCDVVDVHAYWDGIAESTVFQDRPILAEAARGRILERLSECQVDKPCLLGEVDASWPNRYAHEAPLLFAALAARQDLDGVAWFAWSHDRVRRAPDGPNGALDLEGRFNLVIQMPIAAAVRTAVPPAQGRYVRWWSPDGLARDLAEGPGLWMDPLVRPWSYLTQIVRSSFAPVPPLGLAAPADQATPVDWDPERPALSVATPSLESWVGRSGGRVTAPPHLRPALDQYVSVWLTSSDGGPIATARRLVLGAVGRTEREGTVWGGGSRGPDGLLVLGRGPARMERLAGVVWLPGLGRVQAWSLAADGARLRAVEVVRGRGEWGVRLDGVEAPWVEVERQGGGPP